MGRVLHQLAQAAQPHLARAPALVYPLVAPVGRNAALGHLVHAFGADLHLDPAPLGRDGRMERLVAVGLGDRHPVAHALGVGGVEVGDHRVGGPALALLLLARAVDDDAQGEDVVDPLERYVLLAHLGPDGEDRLGAALDVVLHAQGPQPLLDGHQEAGDEGTPLGGRLLELGHDVVVVLRLEVFEGYVLQLALDLVETQLVGDLRIEVHRLPALLAPLLAGEHLQRAHHLEPVGQLDQDDARVLRVADDQVAEVVGLLLGRLELERRDVGHAHADARDLVAEAGADVGHQREELLRRQLLVGQAHDVVQQGGHRGVAAQPHLLDDDPRHGGRMTEQRRAVVAFEPREALPGVVERLVDELLRGLREIFAHQRAKRFITSEIHIGESIIDNTRQS